MKNQATLDLSGTWRLSLSEQTPKIFEHSLQLPGSLQVQGFGDKVAVDTTWTAQVVDRSWFSSEKYAPYRQPGNIKIPFWLQPEKIFKGPAWYQRDVEIPNGWKDKRVTLFLERPHIETTVWLDDVRIGSENSLSAP